MVVATMTFYRVVETNQRDGSLAFLVPNLSETEFSPYLSELRTSGASSVQNLSASDLVTFPSLPPRKDRNTDELRQASLRSQPRRARQERDCWRKSLLVSLHHTS